MGIQCCTSRRNDTEAFSDSEREILASLFEKLCYAKEK